MTIKKSINEDKPNRKQLILNSTKDTYKINVVRSKLCNNCSYMDINDDLKFSPEEKSNVIINLFKGGQIVTSKQSTVSNSKQKELKASNTKGINLNKKKINDLSFNNDTSFIKIPSYKKSNDVSISQLTNTGSY